MRAGAEARILCRCVRCPRAASTISFPPHGSDDGGGAHDAAPPVDAGCTLDSQCTVGVCQSGSCVPTSTDKEKDGDETDTDCGGALDADGTKNTSSDGAPACGVGKGCLVGYDCTSLVCFKNGAGPVSLDGSPIDCPAGATCACQAPTDSDGVKNGSETDIDCGGGTARACAAGKTCAQSTDCASLGCNDSHVCATGRSCIHVDGATTCGSGATGTAGAENDDCCAQIPLTMSSADPTEPSKTISMDKYFITAGRFRAMMDATSGNLRSIVNTTPPPAGWDASWTSFLPTELALPTGAYSQLGPYDQDGTSVNGCDLSEQGNHTYWMPPGTYTNEDAYYVFPDHSVYDRMPMNCAPLYYFAAFCAWDGGRIATVAELQRAWRGPSGAAANSADATREYPWGTSTTNADITAHAIDWNDTGRTSPARVYEPATPPMGQSYTDANINQAGILPPGRSPQGAGPYGHEDLMGLLLVFPAPYKSGSTWYYDFIGTSDFNNHTLTTDATVPSGYVKRAVGEYRYWAVGARCVHDQ